MAGVNSQYKYADWDKLFEVEGVRGRYRRAYQKYIRKLLKSNVPIIFELEHFSKLVGYKEEMLMAMSNSAASFYMNFTIPKRKGGRREIVSPYPSLLHVQRWISTEILTNVPISEHAKGFCKEKSVYDNAVVHCAANHLLKMDIKDFFPSIHSGLIYKTFKKLGYAPNVANFLTRLCCYKGSLPQGAATSPTLSNIVAKKLDDRLAGLAKDYELQYTRYADDFTFSGRHIPLHFSKLTESIVSEEGFCINKEKTQLIRGNGKKIVTGISVCGGTPKLPRKTKRALRQEVFLAIKNFREVDSRVHMSTPLYMESLFGKLTFWAQVEPDNAFVAKYRPVIKVMIQQ